ncbi:MAG: hypothetical protein LH481_17700 [Burkholderiales bacterium]|nr:hypothetical protein [Burkholderiales bacterium]
MHNMKHLAITSAITVFAGLVPLVPSATQIGTTIEMIAIAISIMGLFATLMLYFSQEAKSALTLRDDEFNWH